MSQKWGGRPATQLTALTLATFGTTCHLCGRPGATTADHLIPRSLGGLDELDNLRPAHQSCNSARGNMSIEQWRARFTASTAPRSSRWSSASNFLSETASEAPRHPSIFSTDQNPRGSVHNETAGQTMNRDDHATA